MFNNMSLCHLKRSEYREALYYSKRCLELDPGNGKGWYRKCLIKLESSGSSDLAKTRAVAIGCIKRFPGEAKEFSGLVEIIEKKIRE
jgi:hypothetical protein